MSTSNQRVGILQNAGIPTRTRTYLSAAAMAAVDAIKTSVATSTLPQSYFGAALNGSTGAGAISLPQSVSVTTAPSVATYATGAGNPILVAGVDYDGSVVSGVVVLTNPNGGETLVAYDAGGAVVGFAAVTRLDVPAQLLAAVGALTFGVRDVVLDPLAIDIRSGAGGSLVLGYLGGYTDTVPVDASEHVYYGARVVYGSSTSFPITVGF